MSNNKSIFNKIMSLDMDDDGPDQNNLHKSRFEGDNFRKRYMSKCQGESAAGKLKRIEGAAKLLVSAYCNADSDEICDYMRNLIEELKL